MTLLVAVAILAGPVAGLYFAVWVHELGHVVAARLAGIPVSSAGAGTGGRAVRLRVGGVILFAATRNPFQGVTFLDAGPAPWWGRIAAMYAGGVVANAAVAALAVAGVVVWPTHTWAIPAVVFAALNSLLAVGNLIPMSASASGVGLRSDGARLLALLTRRGDGNAFSDHTRMLRAFGPLWRTIGDGRSLATLTAATARGWAEARNPARAAELLTELSAIPDPGETAAFNADLARVWLAVAAGDVGAAGRASDDAAARVSRPGADAARVAVELDRADSLIRLGDPAGAGVVLESIAADPAIPAAPDLGWGVRALAYRLGRAAVPPEVPEGGASPQVWHAMLMGERSAEVRDWAGAEWWAQAAGVAVGKLAAELAVTDRDGLGPLRREIEQRRRHAVAEQGRDPDAESFVSQPGRNPGAARREGRRCLAAGLILGGLAVSAVVALVVAGSVIRGPHDGRLWALPFGVYALVAASFALTMALLAGVEVTGRNPARQEDYGSRALARAWLAVAAAVVCGVVVGFATLL